jgi:hypothetical protein
MKGSERARDRRKRGRMGEWEGGIRRSEGVE